MKKTRVGYVEDRVATEVVLFELESGEEIEKHYHEYMTEVIIFKGHGVLYLAESQGFKIVESIYRRSPGDIVVIRPFQFHRLVAEKESLNFVSIRYPYTKDDEKLVTNK